MRITLNAFGSRGDIQPFIALGIGLQQGGHRVRITTHRIFESFVRQHDLDFYPLELDPRQVLISNAMTEVGRNTFRLTQWMEVNFKPVLGDIFRATLDASQDADMMLNSTLSFAGWHVAQKLDVPAIAVYLQPVTPTRYSPAATAGLPPRWLPFKGAYNYASAKLANQFFFNLLRPLTNACREEVLSLAPLGASYYWPLDSPRSSTPFIYGYSPTVVPKPPDWGEFQQVAGYWFMEEAADYEPPTELVEFLSSGSPPVYVGFGSMVDHEREVMTRIVSDALQMAGERAVLLGGWSELGGDMLPESIYSVDSIPHDWLFPRMTAVVHHGGAGTTAAGLKAGIPTVVIPFFGDQPFWGKRVHELGAGPRPIPRKGLTAEKLAAAIRQAVSDETMRQRAADLGARIRAEDGVGTAVLLVERYASTGGF